METTNTKLLASYNKAMDRTSTLLDTVERQLTQHAIISHDVELKAVVTGVTDTLFTLYQALELRKNSIPAPEEAPRLRVVVLPAQGTPQSEALVLLATSLGLRVEEAYAHKAGQQEELPEAPVVTPEALLETVDAVADELTQLEELEALATAEHEVDDKLTAHLAHKANWTWKEKQVKISKRTGKPVRPYHRHKRS